MRISVVCDRHVHAVSLKYKKKLFIQSERGRDNMLVQWARLCFCIVLKVKTTKKPHY